MTYLVAEGLVKRFDGTTAVNDVSFAIGKGEFVTFLGPSGCGKTTTLRLVAGFLRPERGSIRAGDRLLVDAGRGVFVPPAKRGMGMVFQSYAVWPHMTVFENIAYGLKLKRLAKVEIRRRVQGALNLVRMEGFATRYPPQLSGGEQQRVALARALVTEPDILLFDEPLSNLDAKLREEMRFEIREIQRQVGFTAVYVTHDQAEAMVISDRIAVMGQGRLHQVGTPFDIYKHPADSFVAGFIGLANFVPAEIRRLEDAWAEVHLESGEVLHAPAQAPASPGVKVLLSIRPEEIEFGDPHGDGRNVLAGEVARTVYLGSLVDYQVVVGSHTLRVQTPPPPRFQPRDRVRLFLDPGECTLIPQTR